MDVVFFICHYLFLKIHQKSKRAPRRFILRLFFCARIDRESKRALKSIVLRPILYARIGPKHESESRSIRLQPISNTTKDRDFKRAPRRFVLRPIFRHFWGRKNDRRFLYGSWLPISFSFPLCHFRYCVFSLKIMVGYTKHRKRPFPVLRFWPKNRDDRK